MTAQCNQDMDSLEQSLAEMRNREDASQEFAPHMTDVDKIFVTSESRNPVKPGIPRKLLRICCRPSACWYRENGGRTAVQDLIKNRVRDSGFSLSAAQFMV